MEGRSRKITKVRSTLAKESSWKEHGNEMTENHKKVFYTISHNTTTGRDGNILIRKDNRTTEYFEEFIDRSKKERK